MEALLERCSDMRAVGQTGDAEALVEMAARLEPDVVVTAVDYGEGTLPRLVSALGNGCAAAVLVVGSGRDENAVAESIAAGARGCIREDASPELFRLAMRALAQGDTWVQRELTHLLAHGLRTAATRSDGAETPLTEREMEIARLVAAGHRNTHIAEALFIGASTVGAHVSHILDKLGLESRAGIVRYAIREGLIEA